MSPVVLSGDVFLVWWHHEGPAASDSNGPYDRQVMPLECNLSPRIHLNSPHSRPPTNCYGKPLPANLADHSICRGGAGQVQAPVRTVLAGWLRLPSVLAGTVQVVELAYTSLSLSLSPGLYLTKLNMTLTQATARIDNIIFTTGTWPSCGLACYLSVHITTNITLT